jgi:hypothetical protein
MLLISSRASELISEFGIESSVANVVLACRLCEGSISRFLDANRTAGRAEGSRDAADGGSNLSSTKQFNKV